MEGRKEREGGNCVASCAKGGEERLITISIKSPLSLSLSWQGTLPCKAKRGEELLLLLVVLVRTGPTDFAPFLCASFDSDKELAKERETFQGTLGVRMYVCGNKFIFGGSLREYYFLSNSLFSIPPRLPERTPSPLHTLDPGNAANWSQLYGRRTSFLSSEWMIFALIRDFSG